MAAAFIGCGAPVAVWAQSPAGPQVGPAAQPGNSAPRGAGGAGAARPLTPELRRFAEDCDTLRRGTIHKLEEQVRGVRSGALPVKNASQRIKEIEADIAALRAGRMIVPTLHFPVAVGAIGRLPDVGGYIERVDGPDEMLVRCSFRVQVVVTRHFQPQSDLVHQPALFKVRGVPTQDFAVGSDAELLSVFRVVGSEKSTAGDNQSIPVLLIEPFDIRPIEQYLRDHKND